MITTKSTDNRSKPHRSPVITDRGNNVDRGNHIDPATQSIGDIQMEIQPLDDPTVAPLSDGLSISLLGIACRLTKSDIGNGLLVSQLTLDRHLKNAQRVPDGIRAQASGRSSRQSDRQFIVSISVCQRQTCERCIHPLSMSHSTHAAFVGSTAPGRGTSLVT